MWKVPLFKLNYDMHESNAVDKVLKSQWITMGEKTTLLEAQFENYLGDDLPYNVDTILLTFSQNDLSFGFKGLHYSDPQSNQYKIHLQGYYQDTLYLKHANSINYSNYEVANYLLDNLQITSKAFLLYYLFKLPFQLLFQIRFKLLFE